MLFAAVHPQKQHQQPPSALVVPLRFWGAILDETTTTVGQPSSPTFACSYSSLNTSMAKSWRRTGHRTNVMNIQRQRGDNYDQHKKVVLQSCICVFLQAQQTEKREGGGGAVIMPIAGRPAQQRIQCYQARQPPEILE